LRVLEVKGGSAEELRNLGGAQSGETLAEVPELTNTILLIIV
jgi:hypothetical protein